MGFIKFVDNDTTYPIPQVLDLQPEYLLDEHREVYRIPLGSFVSDAVSQKQYDTLFNLIESKLARDDYLSEFVLSEGDLRFSGNLAYVLRYNKPIRMYELEVAFVDAKFYKAGHSIEKRKMNVRSRASTTNEGKETHRKRKATNKSASR